MVRYLRIAFLNSPEVLVTVSFGLGTHRNNETRQYNSVLTTFLLNSQRICTISPSFKTVLVSKIPMIVQDVSRIMMGNTNYHGGLYSRRGLVWFCFNKLSSTTSRQTHQECSSKQQTVREYRNLKYWIIFTFWFLLCKWNVDVRWPRS